MSALGASVAEERPGSSVAAPPRRAAYAALIAISKVAA